MPGVFEAGDVRLNSVKPDAVASRLAEIVVDRLDRDRALADR